MGSDGSASKPVTLLFDLDGTLVDCSATICRCFNAALRRHRLPEMQESEIKRLIGRPLTEMFVHARGSVPVGSLVSAYRVEFSRRPFEEARLMPGAHPTLRDLGSRARMAIVTSRSHAGARGLVEFFELGGIFECIVGVDDVDQAKPSPEPIRRALSELGRTADGAFYLGDTLDDMRSATAAGVVGIGVTSGVHSEEELREAGAVMILDRLEDLARLLELT